MASSVASLLRSGTLEPPSTATNGTNITRADFQRWAHEDRNHAQADMTRTEREERRRFKQAQMELYRSRGAAVKDVQKANNAAAVMIENHKKDNAAKGVAIREEEAGLKKKRTEAQEKWANHGYELTQQFTIKAAQNNMRSLKAQNAGIVNGMHAKAADRQQMVESQRQAAQDERRARVERIKSETTDGVTRAAKKAYVDERWDVADGMREQLETWRAQRKAQELAYLESALAINASTSMEPAKQAREKARDSKLKASQVAKDRKKAIKEQALADGSSHSQAKIAVHDAVHGLKFVPDAEVMPIVGKDSNRFKTYFAPRTPASSRRKAPYEVASPTGA